MGRSKGMKERKVRVEEDEGMRKGEMSRRGSERRKEGENGIRDRADEGAREEGSPQI